MNRKFFIFSIITCIFSWTCWLPIIGALEASPFESPLSVLLIFFLGAYAPTITGLVLTFWYDGREGIRTLLKRIVSIRVGFRWLLMSLLTGPVLWGLAVIVYATFGGQVGNVNYGLLPWIPVVFIVPVIFGPLAEEIGWRGFALPQLDHRDKPVQSSIIIGFVWALWHTPLFWAKTGTAISGFPVGISLVCIFFLAVIGSSFIYTWLFNRTGESLFLAIMLHLSMNSSGTISGMLFPDLDADQKLSMYQHYVFIVWLIVLTGALVVKKQDLKYIRRTPSI